MLGITDFLHNYQWFRDMQCSYKLAYIYILDNSAPAGAWQIDVPNLKHTLGLEDFSIEGFMIQANRDHHPVLGTELVVPRFIIADGHLVNRDYMRLRYGGKHGEVDPRYKDENRAIEVLQELKVFTDMVEEGFLKLSAPLTEPVRCSYKPKHFCGLPIKGGDDWLIDQGTIDEIYAAYGEIIEAFNVDLPEIFNNMRLWLVANPTRRKTKRGVKAFVFRWVARHFADLKNKMANEEISTFTV